MASRSAPSSWGVSMRIGIPVFSPGPTSAPLPVEVALRSAARTRARASGTTDDTIAASTSARVSARRPSSDATTVASSSAVAKRTVAKRQCSTSSSPRNMPRWVWVLPTSMASSTARRLSRLGGRRWIERRAHRVEAAVDVQDLAADPAGQVGEQEADRVGHRGRVGRVPPQRRLGAPQRRPAGRSRGSRRRRACRSARRTRDSRARAKHRGRGRDSGRRTPAPPSRRPSSRRPARRPRHRSRGRRGTAAAVIAHQRRQRLGQAP